MDLKKIGKFIAKKRAEKGFTQESLAEELDISNRSISKWERGICLPEAAKMPTLCKLFDITINDLFSGEIVDMKNNEKKLEENLLELTKLKEQKDKQLLSTRMGAWSNCGRDAIYVRYYVLRSRCRTELQVDNCIGFVAS